MWPCSLERQLIRNQFKDQNQKTRRKKLAIVIVYLTTICITFPLWYRICRPQFSKRNEAKISQKKETRNWKLLKRRKKNNVERNGPNKWLRDIVQAGPFIILMRTNWISEHVKNVTQSSNPIYSWVGIFTHMQACRQRKNTDSVFSTLNFREVKNLVKISYLNSCNVNLGE